MSASGRGAVLLAALVAGSAAPLATVDAQSTPWKIEMRQVRLPAPNGDCAPIELVVRDASGKAPLTPDGKQVDWQDFDMELTQGAGPLKTIGNGRFLCATAPGATGVITAKYPEKTYLTGGNNKGRTGKLLIPGVTATATLEVRSLGSASVTPASLPAARSASASTAGAALAPVPVPVGTRSPATTASSTPVITADNVPLARTDVFPRTTAAPAVAAAAPPTGAADGSSLQATGPVDSSLATTAHVRDNAGEWQPVGPADWTCLNTPSPLKPSTQPLTISGTSRTWRSGQALANVSIDAFAGTNPDLLLSGAIGTSASSPDGAYSLRAATLPPTISRIGFRSRATGFLDTYELGNYFDPAVAAHSHDVKVVATGAADALATDARVNRRATDALILGSVRDCQGHGVSNATATVSRAAFTSDPLSGMSAAYFDASGEVGTTDRTAASGEFILFNVTPQSAPAYLQVWGYTSEAAAAQGRRELLAVTALPVRTGSAFVASLTPRTDEDGRIDAVLTGAGASASGSPTFVVALPPADAPLPTGRNPGFKNPAAATRANALSGTSSSEVGPADWTCLRTPSAEATPTRQIQLAGTVRSWTSGGITSGSVTAASVAAFAGRPGPVIAGVAAASPAYSMSLGTLPSGTTRIAIGAKAQDHLDTYQLDVPLSPDAGLQSLDVAVVGRAAADTLAHQAGVSRNASLSLLIGTIRDCLGRPVSNAIVTVSAAPETALHVDKATSAYLTPAGQAAPPSLISATTGAGRFMVVDLPAYAGDAYVQVWGFTSQEDVASGRLTLVAVQPTPIPIGSALIADLEPRRD